MRTPSPALLCTVLLALAGAAHAQLYGVPATLKVGQQQAPETSWTAGKLALQCARNESEAGQVVLPAGEQRSGLEVVLPTLRGEGGATLPPSGLRLYRVHWVDINAPYEVDKPSEHPSFQPDPLAPVRPQERLEVEAGSNLVLWLALAVPEQARPGLYRGELQLRQGARVLGTLALQLRVRAFALPRRPLLQSLVSLATGNIYTAHGCKTDDEKQQLVRLYLEEYRRARLSPFLYTAAFGYFPDGAVKWEFVKGADGKPTGEVTLDFSGFDRYAKEYFDERQAFSAFNLAPYLFVRRDKQVVLRIADRSGLVLERRGADGAVDPIFDRVVVAVFRGLAQHLAEHQWLDRAVYYVIDEPGESDTPAIREICELVRQADPRLRTALTYDPASRPRLAELVDAQGRSLISLWVPYCSQYRQQVADEQRRRGADYWLYDVSTTCLIGHSGQTNRAIFWDIWRRGCHGYLYYLSTWWGRAATPWERPNFALPEFTYRYRQGDGYFFYPPLRRGTPDKPILDYVVPTIRWELLREGAEDYDYLAMLDDLAGQAARRKLKLAAEAQRVQAAARDLAEAVSGAGEGHGIRDLTFKATEGWTFGLEEGWLLHNGGKRSDLPISFRTPLPDGEYLLTLNVYDDAQYRNRAFSRFLVNGKPYASPGSSLKGPVDVAAGRVQVRHGRCEFVLSSVPEEYGVILYRVGLGKTAGAEAGDLYAVRAKVADMIERLQAALGK